LVTILVLVSVVGVGAQESTSSKAPGTWASSINLQNPTSTDATVVITFYDSAGNVALDFNVTPDIPANGSRSYYVPAEVPGLADGQYAAAISSSVELQVVANASSSGPATAGAYNGITADQTATSLAFPGLYNNYYGFYSELVIQNTDSASTNVTVSIKQGATEAWSGSFDIPGNASRVLAMADITGLPSGNSAKFAAVVASNDGKNLAAVANIWTDAMYGEFGDYNGYAAGAAAVYAPALYNDYYNFVSALTVMNADTAAADILVTYGNGETETKTLAVGESVEYYQPNNAALPSGNTNGVFSAKVESTNGMNLYALVTVEDKTKGLLASYNCPSESSETILAPVVLKEFYNWFSAATVQNVGAAATNVRITYADASATTQTFTNVPANGTINIIQLAGAGCLLPDGSSVAATIESYAAGGLSAQPLVAVVQENSDTRYASTAGDYLLAYTAVAR
jgi:hypothetical protein